MGTTEFIVQVIRHLERGTEQAGGKERRQEMEEKTQMENKGKGRKVREAGIKKVAFYSQSLSCRDLRREKEFNIA